MGDFVWISYAPSDPTLADGFTKSDLQCDGDEPAIELSKMARRGGAVGRSDLPTEIWGEVGPYRAHHFPNYWPEITYYSGIWIISEAAARILRDFDLGEGVIAPVRRLEMNRVTRVLGEWFCWNIGNVKEAFLPQNSAKLVPTAGRTWRALDASDHDLKCSMAARDGPDAWIDPKLRGVFFLACELGQALKDGGLANEKAGFGTIIKVDLIAD